MNANMVYDKRNAAESAGAELDCVRLSFEAIQNLKLGSDLYRAGI